MEGARGVAALMVFMFHLETVGHHGATGPAGWVLRQMWLGLTFFFVLSGFLLYRPFLRGDVSIGRYFTNRAARIVPAYWVALLCSGAAASGYWSNFLFLQLYGPKEHWKIVPAWTLCIEVSFYLALPAIAVAVRWRPWLLPALIPLGYAYTVAWAQGWSTGYLTLGNYIALFACGMLAAAAVERRLTLPAGRACLVFAAAGLALLQSDAIELSKVGELAMGAAFACVTIMIAQGRLRAFSARPVVALGTISYGFYLWHFGPVSSHSLPAPEPLRFLANVVVLGGLTAAFAVASWFVIERPALRLVSRRREPVLMAPAPVD